MDVATTSSFVRRWMDAEEDPINPPGSVSSPLPGADARLSALAARARADLHALRHPEADWMPEPACPNGKRMVDVLVVGAGQGGLSIAAHLIKERVNNILVIDKQSRGNEGIWNSHGRMPVIRSPKHYPGPDLGIPNLTYESWHRAVFGDVAWARLSLVPIQEWVRYLNWIRDALALPVENRVELTDIKPGPDCLEVTLKRSSGTETRYVRRLILATGHDGTGDWWLPDWIATLPTHLRAQAADPIDFDQLCQKRVAILGIGATGGDNAICALEAGAEVHMFCRRDTHRRQQVYRWCITAGFLRNFHHLDDARRWRFMHYILNTRMGMPPETWKRLSRFKTFTLHTNANWRAVQPKGSGVLIDTEEGPFQADFVICCAGHDQDVRKRQELANLADDIALWSDRHVPIPELTDRRLARYPYLGADFTFQEKVPGAAPWLARIHDFTFGPTMSFGPSGCSISTLRLTVPMLVNGVTQGLFVEDADHHWRSLLDHPDYIP